MWKYLNVLFIIPSIYTQKLQVSVYYESLCPDSIEFITEQFFPTYKELGSKINLDLIPFGNAQVTNVSGKLEFICQHGPKECYGNEIHSCAIALFSEAEGAEFVSCAMNSSDPSLDANLLKCAKSTGISWTSLQVCYKTGQGDKLLEINGARTRMVQPAIQFIPTIVFNGYFNQTLQNDALTEFSHIVCEFLHYEPAVCGKYNVEGVENDDIKVYLV